MGAFVTEDLHDSKHGNTSMLELLEHTLFHCLVIQVRDSTVVPKSTLKFDVADHEENLGPTGGRDSGDGTESVRDVSEWDTGGDDARETKEFLGNVSADGELGNTSMLDLGSAVLVESRLADTTGESERVCKAMLVSTVVATV